jgi:hypothetical protein
MQYYIFSGGQIEISGGRGPPAHPLDKTLVMTPEINGTGRQDPDGSIDGDSFYVIISVV